MSSLAMAGLSVVIAPCAQSASHSSAVGARSMRRYVRSDIPSSPVDLFMLARDALRHHDGAPAVGRDVEARGALVIAALDVDADAAARAKQEAAVIAVRAEAGGKLLALGFGH